MKNKKFDLIAYNHFLVSKWKSKYLKYGFLEYTLDNKSQQDFEILFIENICNATDFITRNLDIYSNQIDFIKVGWKSLGDDEKQKLVKAKEKSVELALRRCRKNLRRLRDYHKFNTFLILKMAKKYEKKNCSKDANFANVSPQEYQYQFWGRCQSYTKYMEFADLRKCIDLQQESCICVYALIFRRAYPELAETEIEYLKSKYDSVFTAVDTFSVGVKCGLALSIVSYHFFFYCVLRYNSKIFASSFVVDWNSI